MRCRKRLLAQISLAALALLCVCMAHTQAQKLRTPTKVMPPPGAYVADELLVQFSDAQTMQRARALHAQVGATLVREFAFAPWQQVRLVKGMTVATALARYRALPGVVAAQPNYRYTVADTTPNDPSFASQYAHTKMHTPTAWDTTT